MCFTILRGERAPADVRERAREQVPGRGEEHTFSSSGVGGEGSSLLVLQDVRVLECGRHRFHRYEGQRIRFDRTFSLRLSIPSAILGEGGAGAGGGAES